MADGEFVGDAEAAMDLDGILADELAGPGGRCVPACTHLLMRQYYGMRSVHFAPPFRSSLAQGWLLFWPLWFVFTIGYFFSLGHTFIVDLVVAAYHRRSDLVVTGIIALVVAICWAAWPRLTVEVRRLSIRYLWFGIPLFWSRPLREISGVTVHTDDLWIQFNGLPPQLSLIVTEAGGRVRSFRLHDYTPSQGQAIARALADAGAAVFQESNLKPLRRD